MRTGVVLINTEKFLEDTKGYPSDTVEIFVTKAIFYDNKVFVDLVGVAAKPVLPKKKWYEFWK
jgi:hypothetical protein